MPGLEPANRSRPVQVAKRKRKPLGHEEIVLRKKSKTKAVTVEDDEISTSLDGQEEPKTFISPERFLDKSKVRDENEELRGFVSPLTYMYFANEDDEDIELDVRLMEGDKGIKRQALSL